VRGAGGVCIADEVQTGVGRVGDHWWAFEQQGVVPDIVTMGKPFGNGMPLAAVVCTRALSDAFASGPEYFNTFGGNPVCAAAGLAVLGVIERDGKTSRRRPAAHLRRITAARPSHLRTFAVRACTPSSSIQAEVRDSHCGGRVVTRCLVWSGLRAHAASTGEWLRGALRSLADEAAGALIGDVRGMGLFIGVEFVRDRVTLEPATAETNRRARAARHPPQRPLRPYGAACSVRRAASGMRSAAYEALCGLCDSSGGVTRRLRVCAVCSRLKDAHLILTSIDGPHDNVLVIKPPLCFSVADAATLVSAMRTELCALAGVDLATISHTPT
jgi:4-aminobutyrate aminotransferase-like enzyme